MDKYILSLFEEFGDQKSIRKPDASYIDSYKGKLPEKLLNYWMEYGFGSFMGGLLWIVDPAEFSDIKTSWVESSDLKNDNDCFHIIARSGYGDFYLWGENSGYCYKINSMKGWIIKQDYIAESLESSIQYFFGSLCSYTVDIEDVDTDEEMFDMAVEKFGILSEDEVFGFTPSLVAGGNMLFDNLQKVNMAVHLDLILQLKKPQVITTNDLTKLAFT